MIREKGYWNIGRYHIGLCCYLIVIIERTPDQEQILAHFPSDQSLSISVPQLIFSYWHTSPRPVFVHFSSPTHILILAHFPSDQSLSISVPQLIFSYWHTSPRPVFVHFSSPTHILILAHFPSDQCLSISVPQLIFSYWHTSPPTSVCPFQFPNPYSHIDAVINTIFIFTTLPYPWFLGTINTPVTR